MTKFLTLVRVGLKSNFGLAILRHRVFSEKKDRWLVPVAGLAALSLGPTLIGYLKLIRFLYELVRPFGQESVLPMYAILFGQLLILLFGIYYVIAAFYFSRDLDILIPLPLKPRQVIASKFTVILVNEYLTVALIILPMFVDFGILAKRGIPYWINAAVVYALLPIIPLGLVSLLVIGMMRLINLSRRKDILIIVGSLVLIGFGIGLQVLVRRSAGSQISQQAILDILTAPDGFLKRAGAIFPPCIWATQALTGGFSRSGLWHLFLLAGTSLLVLYGILVVAERLFYRGLIGLSEVSARKKVLSRREMARRVTSGRRPIRAIFLREWRIMNRTPIFLLNGVLTVAIIPVIFLLMTKMGGSRGDAAALMKAMTSASPMTAVLASAAFMILCGSLNGTSSSAFSREGRQFWMSKVIPVSPQDQVVAKFMHSYAIGLLGVGSSLVVSVAVLSLKFGQLVPALAMALSGTFLLTTLGMTIDLLRPLLDWTNPQKAIKQNLNVLFATVADIGILAGLAMGVVRFLNAGVSAGAVIWFLIVTFALLSAAGFVLLLKAAERRYRDIET
jgi:ABC-2 type transport system permease protein